MKYYIIIVLIFLTCCKTIDKTKNTNGKNRIVYTVFDSLENYLSEEIKNKLPYDTVQAIIIDPLNKIANISPELNNKICDNIFYFSILYKSKGYNDTIIEKSNRYFLIKDKLYPIYFYGIDDVFGRGKNNHPYESGYIPRDWHLESLIYFTVDMARKEFYVGYDQQPRGRKK